MDRCCTCSKVYDNGRSNDSSDDESVESNQTNDSADTKPKENTTFDRATEDQFTSIDSYENIEETEEHDSSDDEEDDVVGPEFPLSKSCMMDYVDYITYFKDWFETTS